MILSSLIQLKPVRVLTSGWLTYPALVIVPHIMPDVKPRVSPHVEVESWWRVKDGRE